MEMARQDGRRKRLAVYLLAAMAWFPAPGAEPGAGAKAVSGFSDLGLAPKPGAEQTVVVEYAEESEYDLKTGWIHARGNVVVVSGDQELRADRIDVDTKHRTAVAEGNVVLRRGRDDKSVLKFDRLEYDFAKQTADMQGLSGQVAPFRLLESDGATRQVGNVFVVRNAKITTCTNAPEDVHYEVHVRELEVVPNDYLEGHGMSWWFGSVPVMYMPYWYRDLEDNLGYNVQPGYSSRMGAFLLNSYSYRLTPHVKGQTHLDYRTRRGVAVGQDVKWSDRAEDERWRGDVSGYFANDQEPVDDDDAGWEDIQAERYRLRLRHFQSITDRDYLRVGGQYLSDPDVLQDFFRREYRQIRQPENYIDYTHREDLYQVGVLMRSRLNDFYSEVNRLPEASLNFFRTPIGGSRFHYESQSSAGYLEKVWSVGETNQDDYAATRIDSAHMIYYPDRYFGFLNVVPRAGARLTYYSETLAPADPAVTNGPITVPAGSGTRFRPETGVETSYRAYRTWVNGFVSPLRHVAEPYGNYTLAPEPNLTPDELHPFDEVDQLDLDHSVKVGMRNMWQTKRESSVRTFLDTDVYTKWRVQRQDEQEILDLLSFAVRVRPYDELQVNMDGSLDFYNDFINQFTVEAVWQPDRTWKIRGEYRQRQTESRLIAASGECSPSDEWTLGLDERYEMEGSRLEEIGGFVQRNYDCMALRTRVGFQPGYENDDGTRNEDDWEFAVEFWLTAFPEFTMGSK